MIEVLQAAADWLAENGLYIVFFSSGIILTALVWMKKHPEDFFYYDEDDEQEIELEEIDHA